MLRPSGVSRLKAQCRARYSRFSSAVNHGLAAQCCKLSNPALIARPVPAGLAGHLDCIGPRTHSASCKHSYDASSCASVAADTHVWRAKSRSAGLGPFAAQLPGTFNTCEQYVFWRLFSRFRVSSSGNNAREAVNAAVGSSWY